MNFYRDLENNYKIIKENEEKIQIIQDNYSINTQKLSELSLITITDLQLVNCNLIEFQPIFVQLQQLKVLNLSNNRLVEVPACLYSNFQQLEVLDLSKNQLKNFDIEPACCQQLKVLKLNNNQLQNIPEWCLNRHSINLEQLGFSCNDIKNLQITRDLNNLQHFELCNCGLTDKDLISLKSCKRLNHLDLSNNKCRGKGINLFNNFDDIFYDLYLINLKVLNLNGLLLSLIPKSIFWLEHLIELHLSNCELSWLLSEIKYLINLEILDVSNNLISHLPDELFELKHLKILKCSTNVISQLQQRFESKHLLLTDFYYNNFEQFPTVLETIELIDLEMNYFDTNNNDVCYQTKKMNLRKYLNDETRFDGKRILEDLDDNSSGRKSYSSSSDWENYYENCNECLIVEDIDDDDDDDDMKECWDVDTCLVKHPKLHHRKHDDITTSDDEFVDFDLNFKKHKKKTVKHFIDINEDWIFCDVD